MNEGLYKKVVITEVRQETTDFKSFVLGSSETIGYKSGQYLTLVHEPGGNEIRRSYSITSSPDLGEPLSIGVKRQDNGVFSRQLVDNAKQGDVLTVTGAGGFFILPEDIGKYARIFFLAAGSGITPVYSLLKTCLHIHSHLHIVLVYSNASPEKAVFLEPLRELQRQYEGRLDLDLLFSNDPDLRKARLNRELLLSIVDRYSSRPYSDALFYICGPESYIRMCTYVLQEHGVPATHLRRENFVVPISAALPAPPDKLEHRAHIRLGEEEAIVQVKYPDSILKAAKKQGLVLPYSCEAGRCGNCAAVCTRGSVWHSCNEVLTEEDLARGFILTCTGHPVGGDVYLRIGS